MLSACMLIFHKGHTDTIQVYSVTVMTHVKALHAGHSSQGTSEPITPVIHILRISAPVERSMAMYNVVLHNNVKYTCILNDYLVVGVSAAGGF